MLGAAATESQGSGAWYQPKTHRCTTTAVSQAVCLHLRPHQGPRQEAAGRVGPWAARTAAPAPGRGCPGDTSSVHCLGPDSSSGSCYSSPRPALPGPTLPSCVQTSPGAWECRWCPGQDPHRRGRVPPCLRPHETAAWPCSIC